MTGRWLVLCGVVLVGLLIALVVMVRRDAAPPVTMQRLRDTAVVVEPPVVHRLALDAAPDASERDNALASLRASGVGDEVWNGQATTLLDSFATNGVSINDRACFIAGCAATFTFASDRDYRERAAELVETDAYRAWTGGKRFTSTETRGDGRIVVALLLYRPD